MEAEPVMREREASRVPIVQTISNGRLVERDQQREAASNTRAAKAMREQEDMDLRELVESFGAEKSYELKIIRRKPKQHNGVNIEGHLDTFEEWVTEEEIADMFGGGTYTLKVFRPNAKGSMVFFKSATVKIPGPPKGPGIGNRDDDDDDDRGGPHFYPQMNMQQEDPSVVSQAISTLQGIIETQRNSGMDPAIIEALTGPMQTQIAQLQQMQQMSEARIADKDNKIMELLTKPVERPDTSASDRLMDKMFDSNNTRMESMRAMHESEIRMLRENHREDIKRIEDRFERQIHSLEEAHKREIANMARSSDMMTNASQIGYQSQIEVHKMEAERLRGDLATLRAEVVELRAKKEKTLIEQASELAMVGEKLSSLGLGGFGKDEEEEPHWAEKLIGGVIENPEIVATVAQGFQSAGAASTPPIVQQPTASPPQAPQTPQAQASPGRQGPQPQLPAGQQSALMEPDEIPIGQPFRDPNDPSGQIYVRIPPDGSVVTYEQALKMAEDERRAFEEAQAKEEEKGPKKPTPAQVKLAVTFAEGAYKNGTPPETFAQTARNTVPGDLLDYIEEVGVDEFLNSVAKLDQDSPLRTQAGRNYMREVARFLLTGEVG